jgi:RNA polymerase sigma-70 factor, ECF subfamily
VTRVASTTSRQAVSLQGLSAPPGHASAMERSGTVDRLVSPLPSKVAFLSFRSQAHGSVGALGGLCYSPAVPTELPLPRAVVQHADALFRVARRLTGSDADAEDLVQDTFARALAARSQFVPGSNLRAWLFRILRNAHVDLHRRSRRNPVRGSLDDDIELPSVTEDPLRGDDELERLRRIVAEDIEAALLTLSVDARTVILLDLEGLTETELSDVVGCGVGTVKSRLSRARAALRIKLRDYSR